MRIQNLLDTLNQLRTCRFERPEIRRNLKFFRYGSIVVAMLVFGSMLAVTLVARMVAAMAATGAGNDGNRAAAWALSVLLPYTIGFVVFTLILAEAMYYSYRAYLLRRLNQRRLGQPSISRDNG